MPFQDNESNHINTIDKLVEYYFPIDGSLSPAIPRSCQVRTEQAIIALVAITGAAPYLEPAYNYALATYGSNLSMAIYIVVAAGISATSIFYNATMIFLETHRRAYIPEELEGLLKSTLLPHQMLSKKVTLGIGSTISAFPLASLTLIYPFSFFPSWMKYLIFSLVLIDDAILHFLPIEFAFQSIIYRLPLYPFEKLYALIEDSQLSPEVIERREIEQKNAQKYMEMLKLPLIASLVQASIALNIKPISVNAYLNYDVNLPNNLQRNTFTQLSSHEKLSALVEYGNDIASSPRNENVQYILGFLGAIWGVAGDSGFLLIPIQAMINYFDSTYVGIFATALPTYFFGVLVAFFGSCSLLNFWNYMTEWGSGDAKLPLQFKLHPKDSCLFLLFVFAIASVSYATSVELIIDAIDAKNPIRPALIGISISSTIFITLNVLLESYCLIQRDILLYAEKNDAQWITQLSAEIAEFINAIELLDNAHLLNYLQSLNETQLKKIGFSSSVIKQCSEEVNSEIHPLNNIEATFLGHHSMFREDLSNRNDNNRTSPTLSR